LPTFKFYKRLAFFSPFFGALGGMFYHPFQLPHKDTGNIAKVKRKSFKCRQGDKKSTNFVCFPFVGDDNGVFW
jgi:hypothetical protein